MESFRWANHSPDLLGALAQLYKNVELIDCILDMEGGSLKGHKAILAACSPYLKNMFLGHKGVIEISLKDVKYHDMKHVLDFIYYGEVDIPSVEMASFMKTADVLQITSLKRSVPPKVLEKFLDRDPSESSTRNSRNENCVRLMKNAKPSSTFQRTLGISEEEDLSLSINRTVNSCTVGVTKTKVTNHLTQLPEEVNDHQSKISIPCTNAADKFVMGEVQESLEVELNPFAFVALPSVSEKILQSNKQSDLCSYDANSKNLLEDYSYNCDSFEGGNAEEEEEYEEESRMKVEMEEEVVDNNDADSHGTGNVAPATESYSCSYGLPCGYEMKQASVVLTTTRGGGKRKHVTLSLSEKLKVLQRLDKGESLQKIARELNVGVSTIKDWRKNRKDIESFTVSVEGENVLKSRKTLRKAKLDLLDNALWKWFCQERRRGAPLSGPIIKEKAQFLHRKLQVEEEFAASEGWIDRWKARHGVRFVAISGRKIIGR